MKKSLHILLVIALCLLIFCAACGKDGTADNNTDPTPDPTPVTDPDGTGDDTTPPDGTGDAAPVYTPIPDEPGKTYDSYTLDIPTAVSAAAKKADAEAVSIYRTFLDYYSTSTAYNLQNNQEITYAKLQRGGNVGTFSIVDFGLDGKLEVALYYAPPSSGCQVLFCEDGKLYTIGVRYDRILDLKYNGICRALDGDTESYELVQFNSRDGRVTQPLASVKKDADKGEQYYFIHADFEDGKYLPADTRQVSKGEYDAFVEPIKNLPNLKRWDVSTGKTQAFSTFEDSQEVPNPVINRDLAYAKKEPVDDEKLANKDTLKRYRSFLGDRGYAIELQTGEKGSFYELERLNNSYIDYTAFVDFGLDGVFEMVIVPTSSSEPVTVAFYDNGEIYVEYFDCNELKLLTYDGLCKNSGGGIDRLTFSAQNGCVRQPVISVTADPETGKTAYYSHADSREITQAEYDGFMTEQTYPVYYDNESRYNMFSVISAAEALPDEATVDANRQVLQIYYDFINGACTALDIGAGEQVVFDELIRQGRNRATLFTLVDFGSDGVLEMMIQDKNYHYYSVLYYLNGQLYTDSITHRGVGDLTYTGTTYGSGGTSGTYYMITYTAENGRDDWTILSHGLDFETQVPHYYLYAAYENGKLVPAEKTEVDKYTYFTFLENEPLARWYTFNDENLKKYLKVDSVTPAVQPDEEIGEPDLEVTAGGRVITEEYAVRLIEELEEWCNCAPFYSFDFEYAGDLSSETLLRAYRVLAGAEDTDVLGLSDITAVLDKYFKNYSFSLDRCTGSLEAGAVLVPNGWQDLDIDITEMTGEDNLLRFTATLKKGWVKSYVIEFCEDGYRILKARELESPDTAEQNKQAVQAYYEWLTGARSAMSVSNHKVLKYREGPDLKESLNVQYSRFAFADFGSDGILELVLEYESLPSNHLVLYYDDGNLYYGTVYCEELKANGYLEYDDDYYGLPLIDHYIQRYAPSKGEYTILIGSETPPSKDTENPIYRLYFEYKNGEYVQYMGDSSKDVLYDQLVPMFSAPDVVWHSCDGMLSHEFFANIADAN